MSYIMVDIEADGPIPGDYSMICLGAVIVDQEPETAFYGKLKSYIRGIHSPGSGSIRVQQGRNIYLR